MDLPGLGILVDLGLMDENILWNTVTTNPVLIEGINHLDPMFCSANKDYRDDDNVIEMLLDWAEGSM